MPASAPNKRLTTVDPNVLPVAPQLLGECTPGTLPPGLVTYARLVTKHGRSHRAR